MIWEEENILTSSAVVALWGTCSCVAVLIFILVGCVATKKKSNQQNTSEEDPEQKGPDHYTGPAGDIYAVIEKEKLADFSKHVPEGTRMVENDLYVKHTLPSTNVPEETCQNDDDHDEKKPNGDLHDEKHDENMNI